MIHLNLGSLFLNNQTGLTSQSLKRNFHVFTSFVKNKRYEYRNDKESKSVSHFCFLNINSMPDIKSMFVFMTLNSSETSMYSSPTHMTHLHCLLSRTSFPPTVFGPVPCTQQVLKNTFFSLSKWTYPSKRHNIERVSPSADGLKEVLITSGWRVIHL